MLAALRRAAGAPRLRARGKGCNQLKLAMRPLARGGRQAARREGLYRRGHRIDHDELRSRAQPRDAARGPDRPLARREPRRFVRHPRRQLGHGAPCTPARAHEVGDRHHGRGRLDREFDARGLPAGERPVLRIKLIRSLC